MICIHCLLFFKLYVMFIGIILILIIIIIIIIPLFFSKYFTFLLSFQLLHRFSFLLQSGSHRLHYRGLEKLCSSETHRRKGRKNISTSFLHQRNSFIVRSQSVIDHLSSPAVTDTRSVNTQAHDL